MALENIHKIFENDVMTEISIKLEAFNQLKFKKWMTKKKRKQKKKKEK